MNLHHLAVFQAVAETGSIRAGAARLRISEPAVSRQVRDFEHRLGTALFDRLPRGMRLTSSGEVLSQYARRIFAIERQAETALAELRNLDAGDLAIGASTTIGNYLLPPILAEYARRHPGIRVELDVGNTEEIQKHLLEDRLDVGLTAGLVGHDDLRASVFMHDRLVVVAAPGFIARNTRSFRVEELADLPWVTREAGSGTRAVLEQALAEHGLKPRQVMALASTEAIKRAVAAGAGIAVVSDATVTTELQQGELVRLSAQAFPVRRPLHLLLHRHRQPSRAAAAFLALLTESAHAGG